MASQYIANSIFPTRGSQPADMRDPLKRQALSESPYPMHICNLDAWLQALILISERWTGGISTSAVVLSLSRCRAPQHEIQAQTSLGLFRIVHLVVLKSQGVLNAVDYANWHRTV